jgi:hypothetical protein
MTEAERLDQIEHNCLVLATVLGMCAGRSALAEGDSRHVDYMNAAAAGLKMLGIEAALVDAFTGGAKVGMEPCPPEDDGLPNNVVEILRKAA